MASAVLLRKTLLGIPTGATPASPTAIVVASFLPWLDFFLIGKTTNMDENSPEEEKSATKFGFFLLV